MIITLDGPAGSGKSTAAKMTAKHLGFNFLNTGAMYRAVTLQILNQKISIDDKSSIQSMLNTVQITFNHEKVFLNGHEVTSEIRTPEVDHSVSAVSSLPEVRARMGDLQRKTGLSGNYVVEGRDMGTVVFPLAEFKFYIDASPEERARRRTEELRAKGEMNPEYKVILSEIIRRDDLDKNREIAPLRVPDGAVVLDTTHLSIDEVVETIVRTITS